MSEMAAEGGGESLESAQGTETSSESTSSESTGGGNPAWSEILGVLPDSLHKVVTPALEKWDTNYQSGIQKVHSQYEPYKEIIDQGFDPQTIAYALSLVNELENDPRKIYDALAEHNGWSEQGQSETEETDSEYEVEDDPRIARATQLSETVAEYIMDQHQQQEAAAEDEALNSHIASLKEQHGITDDDPNAERFVIGLMLAGASAEDAFDQYMGIQQSVSSRPRANDSAPMVVGNNGGVPSTAIDRSQLQDPKARRALVAQLLEQANS